MEKGNLVMANKLLNRNKLVKYLDQNKIITRLLFAGNLVRQPGFKKTKYRIIDELINTDKVMNDGFWIGLWPGLDAEQLNFMIEKIKDYIHLSNN